MLLFENLGFWILLQFWLILNAYLSYNYCIFLYLHTPVMKHLILTFLFLTLMGFSSRRAWICLWDFQLLLYKLYAYKIWNSLYIFFHTLWYYNIIFQVTHVSLPESFILPDFARHMLPNHHPHLILLSRVMVQFF